MTRREKFIEKLMPNIHYCTLIRWKKLQNEGKLLLPHDLKNRKGNRSKKQL